MKIWILYLTSRTMNEMGDAYASYPDALKAKDEILKHLGHPMNMQVYIIERYLHKS